MQAALACPASDFIVAAVAVLTTTGFCICISLAGHRRVHGAGPACVFTGLYLQLYDPQASFVTGLLYPGLHIPRAQLGRITRRLYLDACTGATSAKDFGWVPIAFSTQHPVEHTVLVLQA